jgi:DNA modification methylase
MTLKITYKKIEDLIPYANNSRTHSDAQIQQLTKSIQEFGWTNPVLLDGENGIIAGHGRLLAAQKLGETKVPTIELSHLDENQKRAYIIADNKLALNAGWDNEILSFEIAELKDAGYDLDLLGFSSEEIDTLKPEVIEGLTDEDAVPEVPEEPKTKLGDIYQMGNHRLMCGDSTSIDAVDKLMDGQKADMVFTDPPYGVSYTGGAKKWDGIKNDSLQNENLVDFLNAVFNCGVLSTKDSAPWYIWHASNTSADFYQALQQIGKKPSAQIIWVKNIMAGGFGDYRGKHEPCIYCSGGKNAWHGGRDQHTIWNIDRERNYQHPTQKPVALAEKALGNSSKSGDTIVDFFGGSGSTMIACEKQNRHARLMELDPKYCDVIVKRWEDFTGKEAILLNANSTI